MLLRIGAPCLVVVSLASGAFAQDASQSGSVWEKPVLQAEGSVWHDGHPTKSSSDGKSAVAAKSEPRAKKAARPVAVVARVERAANAPAVTDPRGSTDPAGAAAAPAPA